MEPGGDDTEGWIARGSLTRHLTSAGHQDALASYETERWAVALSHAQGTSAAVLNVTPISLPQQPPPPLPWIPGDLRHLDPNGIDPSELMKANYSAGNDETKQIQARSKALLEQFSVEEIQVAPQARTGSCQRRPLGRYMQCLIWMRTTQQCSKAIRARIGVGVGQNPGVWFEYNTLLDLKRPGAKPQGAK